ncbi:MAG: hypothetical protein ACPGEC_03145, partial [Flavobacteriales bacterium]
FDRIYLIMNELNKFPDLQTASVQLCFMNFGTEEAQTAMGYLKQLRKGISLVWRNCIQNPSK